MNQTVNGQDACPYSGRRERAELTYGLAATYIGVLAFYLHLQRSGLANGSYMSLICRATLLFVAPMYGIVECLVSVSNMLAITLLWPDERIFFRPGGQQLRTNCPRWLVDLVGTRVLLANKSTTAYLASIRRTPIIATRVESKSVLQIFGRLCIITFTATQCLGSVIKTISRLGLKGPSILRHDTIMLLLGLSGCWFCFQSCIVLWDSNTYAVLSETSNEPDSDGDKQYLNMKPVEISIAMTICGTFWTLVLWANCMALFYLDETVLNALVDTDVTLSARWPAHALSTSAMVIAVFIYLLCLRYWELHIMHILIEISWDIAVILSIAASFGFFNTSWWHPQASHILSEIVLFPLWAFHTTSICLMVITIFKIKSKARAHVWYGSKLDLYCFTLALSGVVYIFGSLQDSIDTAFYVNGAPWPVDRECPQLLQTPLWFPSF